MSRTATATGYLYLDCPKCKQGIAEPFSRNSGPRVFVHGHAGERCRLLIWPDFSSDEDRAWAVPHDMSLESALMIARQYREMN